MIHGRLQSGIVGAIALAVCLPAGAAPAANWPTWRGDAARSGSTAHRLPEELHLQWTLRLGPLRPAWADEPRMEFDAAYQPIVVGQTMYVGSSRDDSLAAHDLADGRLRWRFHADGPVRFAPAAWGGRLYLVSDDGHLYCLDGQTGQLRWKFRGGPAERRLLGNERLISAWPARGGPVAAATRDGGAAIYFAAGIWPFMGVFLYAVDADSGREIWCNDGSGALYVNQPHNSPAFAGLAPQGYLAVAGDKLLVPNGRAAAAILDRHSGKLLHFPHAAAKQSGHSEVAAAGDYYLNSGSLARLSDGKAMASLAPKGKAVEMRTFRSTQVYFDRQTEDEIAVHGEVGVLAGGVNCQSLGNRIVARDVRRPIIRVTTDSRGRQVRKPDTRLLWELPTRARPMLAAGGRLYAAGAGEILAIDLPAPSSLPALPKNAREIVVEGEDKPQPLPRISWRAAVEGTPAGMIAAAGRLILVTGEGDIRCYGGQAVAEAPVLFAAPAPPAGAARDAAAAEELIRATGIADGYCLVLGLKDGHLAEGLAARSRLRVIAVDGNAARVERFRRRIDRAALPAERLAAIVADPLDAGIAPYLASLIVSEDFLSLSSRDGIAVEGIFPLLRPYGGMMCLAVPAGQRDGLARRVGAARLAGANLSQTGRWMVLERRGPLPGAGAWTGQYGDPSNTCVSEDDLVRAPLGLLWFGGPSSEGLLPRHGHGPPEQIIGGRLFIEGANLLRAMDVYTGRLLWDAPLYGVGKPYDNTNHQPGANALGTNFIAAQDGVYVLHGTRCVRLDPATGKAIGEMVLPPARLTSANSVEPSSPKSGEGDANAPLAWSYLAAWEDLLVAAGEPAEFWAADFRAEEFLRKIKTKDRGVVPAYSAAALRALAEEVEAWRDFDFIRPATVVDPPPPGEPTRKMPPRPAGDLDFLLANLNRMLGFRDVPAKLPARLAASVRARDAADLAKWEEARQQDDTHSKPRPESIEELQALVEGLLASGEGTLEDGRDVAALNRQILERCYSKLPKAPRPKLGQDTLDGSASRELVVLDRRGGRVLWRRAAQSAYRHNAICVGGGMVYCIDRLPTPVTDRLSRRGEPVESPAELLALDARSGRAVWTARGDVFGTFLSYSAEHDILLESGRPSRDMLTDEPSSRLTAYRGRTGQVLWTRRLKYAGPCMIHGRTILTQEAAADLLTGQKVMRTHPLTGEQVPWGFRRNYGCNTVIASRHLLTFRSAAAGYFDFAGDGGTGNLGGFRSGCTSNLIAADGVLNAPDYTRTCTCSYQNRCSLALIAMPEAEMWTFQDFSRGTEPIRRLGLNLGAPGDRKAPDGTLWLEYPYVGGRTPNVDVRVMLAKDGGLEDDKPADARSLQQASFRRHSWRMSGEGWPWVTASGIEGVREVTVVLAGTDVPDRTHTVRLYFAEPGSANEGERVFDVAVMGRTVVKGLDVAAEAGGPWAGVVKTVTRVRAGEKLEITLTPAKAALIPRPILCGVEVVADANDGRPSAEE